MNLYRFYTELDFSDEFQTWMVVHNFTNDDTCGCLCGGWEL